MEPYDIIVQGISIIAMILIILSYQFKTQRGILIMQLLGATLFAVHFLMLGAYVGGILNIAAVMRAIVFSNRDKFRAGNIWWTVFFCLGFGAAYVLTFTVFGTAATFGNFVIELLPVIGMIIMTFAFAGDDAKKIRVLGLVNSPCWLIYNLFNLSIGGILCETFSLISITSAFIRIDMKEMKEKKRGSDL